MKKRIMSILAAVLVVSVTASAAVPLSEISTKVNKNVEYNGKTYKYAIEKQYETNNSDTEIPFDEEYEGAELAEVGYEQIDVILQKETLQETKDYKNLLVKDESKIADSITVDGNIYKLDNVTWSEEPIIEDVSYTVDYGYQTAEPTPDETYEYTYTSPVTEEKNTVILPFVRMESSSSEWVDGFTAIVTFHNLEGKYFDIGGTEIEYDAGKILLGAKEYASLVKMLGYNTSKYRFNSISWSGAEYEEDGHTCRNAIVTGQQYASKYQAIYEDQVENGSQYTAKATYICEVELPAEEAAPTYVMKATGYYDNSNVWTNIITFVTQHKAISFMMIGVILLFIILIVGLILRKQKAAYEEATTTES